MLSLRKIVKHFVYWYINKPLDQIKMRTYYLKPLKTCTRINCEIHKLQNESIDLVVVSFNNANLVKLQIQQIEKYCLDPYQLTIADNSTDEKKSFLIYTICKKKNVGYIRLPKQNKFSGSFSNGIAINWMYLNFIRKREPKYFGFLDHDIFPVSPFAVIPRLKTQKFYGLRHYGINKINENVWDSNSPEYWYLWAGFCFYNYQAIKNTKIDFTPLSSGKTFFDTGGSNFLSLYSSEDVSKLCFPNWERIKIREGEIRQSDYVDFIDNKWVHTINGSNWMEVSGKDAIIEKTLLQFENNIHKE